MRIPIVVIGLLTISAAAFFAVAQTGDPATRPSSTPPRSNPDDMLRQLLTPSRPAQRPLDPVPDSQAVDRASTISVLGRPEPRALIREGEIIPQRVGRLTRNAEGQAEFVFESDGQSLQDPPMIVLPNLKLMAMENAIKNNNRDLRFRITGMVTEYNGRNYILVETFIVPQDPTIK